MFIIVSGPSGVGKNTVIKRLMEEDKNMEFLKSCSTRKPREGKKEYYYFSFAKMQKMIGNGELFESEEVHGNIYGVLIKSIDEMVNSKVHYIKDIGVIGQKYFKKELSDKIKILSIFLDGDDKILRDRLEKRGEKEIDKRMERYQFERSMKGNYDIVINNINLEETVKKIQELIKKFEK